MRIPNNQALDDEGANLVLVQERIKGKKFKRYDNVLPFFFKENDNVVLLACCHWAARVFLRRTKEDRTLSQKDREKIRPQTVKNLKTLLTNIYSSTKWTVKLPSLSAVQNLCHRPQH